LQNQLQRQPELSLTSQRYNGKQQSHGYKTNNQIVHKLPPIVFLTFSTAP